MTTPTREPRRYGQERPDLCIEEVHEHGTSYYYQCSRPRGYGTDGLYCKQHDPETVKARREAADLASKARWDKKWYVCRRPEHAAFDALLAALELLLEQETNLAGECGWCFQSPWGHCERPSCPGVIARAAIAKATENLHHCRPDDYSFELDLDRFTQVEKL